MIKSMALLAKARRAMLFYTAHNDKETSEKTILPIHIISKKPCKNIT